MRAAVFHAPGDVRVEERPTPTPSPGQVVVRVAACGVCGTDRHIYHGEYATRPPVIIGHEYAGEVVAVGPQVSSVVVGDAVAIDPNIACGICRPCRRALPHLCCQSPPALCHPRSACVYHPSPP